VVKNFYARNANAGNQQQAVNTFRSEGAQLVTAMTATISAANEYRTTAVSEDRAGAWTAIATSLTQASMVLEQIRRDVEDQLRAVTANDTATVSMLDQQADVERDQFLQFMQSAEQTLNGAIVAGQARVTEVYNASIVSIIVGLGVAVVLAIVITYGIRRSIVVPLTAFMEFVERVGRGDLAGRTANVSADEIGRLGGTLNTMVDGLRQLAKQTRDATENLNAATAEIRASTQEQAAGVEEQLAAVQETAATVDEITHAGTQIGKRAQEVIATAQATANTSTQGLRAVDDTSRAMDAIREQAEAVAENIVSLSEKTQAIGDIITTVNDISERSHLLALNAAIEAAAAGENGRSFAVVASEMKLLADQAKEATGQVRAILGDIQRGINSSVMLTEEAVKRVAAGKERTDTTQRTITEMTARVQEGVQTFQQIVASTNQQQLGIEQVMGALQNIRQASQQTAAGTRQLDAAAANLAGLSQQLLTLAERYRY
jgi:methyl-accepting chemotaxis protein